MLQRRYPHADTGRIAAPIFAVGGLLAGGLVAGRMAHAPPPIANGALWGALAAAVSFLVFASAGEGRPPSVRQGAAADGVVAGILISMLGFVLDLLISSATAGSSGGPSLWSFLPIVAFGLIGGAAGGVLGLVGAAVAPRHFDRPAPASSRSRRTRGRSRRGRRR